eukprot:6172140-Pleurochrysis_carterae.AAC.1
MECYLIRNISTSIMKSPSGENAAKRSLVGSTFRPSKRTRIQPQPAYQQGTNVVCKILHSKFAR